MSQASEKTLQAREKELALAQKRLDAEKEALHAEKEHHARRGWRDNLYGRINVKIKTMDRFIIGVSVLLFAAIIVGIVM